MSSLTPQQIENYNDQGYVDSINVLSFNEVNEIRKEIEQIENKWPNILEGLGRNYVHLISPVFDSTMYGGLVFSGHLDVIDSSRATIHNRDYDMTGSIGILGQLKF